MVLSKSQYERLTGTGESLVDFMRRSPLFETDDVDFERDTSFTWKAVFWAISSYPVG